MERASSFIGNPLRKTNLTPNLITASLHPIWVELLPWMMKTPETILSADRQPLPEHEECGTGAGFLIFKTKNKGYLSTPGPSLSAQEISHGKIKVPPRASSFQGEPPQQATDQFLFQSLLQQEKKERFVYDSSPPPINFSQRLYKDRHVRTVHSPIRPFTPALWHQLAAYSLSVKIHDDHKRVCEVSKSLS